MDTNTIKYNIEESIYFIRGHKVMLSNHLAELYQVTTKALNQAVRRNAKRLPEDFAFMLSIQEVKALRSQNVTLDTGRGKHSKYPTYAFTQEGIAMLSGILRSDTAIQANVAILSAVCVEKS